MSTFKAHYTTELRTIDQKITARNLFLMFLNNVGIPFKETDETFIAGYVEIDERYKPAVTAHSKYWAELAKGEEQFMAEVMEFMEGVKDTDIIKPPKSGLPTAEDQAKVDVVADMMKGNKELPVAPEMKKVSSTNVDSFGYTPATKTLRVKFINGSVYDYHDVPAEIAEGLGKAQSPGGFIAAHVKGGFKYTQLP